MECQNYFGLCTIATVIRKKKATFLYKLVNSQNELCELFSFVAQEEINIILILNMLWLYYVVLGSFCRVILWVFGKKVHGK